MIRHVIVKSLFRDSDLASRGLVVSAGRIQFPSNTDNMLKLRTQITLWGLAGTIASTSFGFRKDANSGRDFDPIAINGSDVPTTTDFAAPETTDANSDIANAYRSYIQACGQDLQQANQEAVGAYNDQFKTNPSDPNAPNFVAWAYSNVPVYKGSYQACENRESTYQSLLATFVPDTSSVTNSVSGTGIGVSPSMTEASFSSETTENTVSSSTSASQPVNSGEATQSGEPNGSSYSYPSYLILFLVGVLTVPALLA
ncbi:hypothetical protein DFH07DRAFT_775216 [Mycena maculata]|uniref:Uncharacterized protein n=1 Tax=Mycena maculata TaxID=230809 RepID=A0AAD7N8R3_9AGAR|nr:hypothetical protein DFH07DRAFT_775216 [Mycena maculata]